MSHQKKWICDTIVEEFRQNLHALIFGDNSPATALMLRGLPVDTSKNPFFRGSDHGDSSDDEAEEEPTQSSHSDISMNALRSEPSINLSSLSLNPPRNLKRKNSSEEAQAPAKKQREENYLLNLKSFNVKKLAFFDLETTGLDLRKAEIVEICVITYDLHSDTWDTLKSYISPLSNHWTDEAEQANGISQKMVQDKPLLSELWPDIFEMMSNSHLVGYNINNFDIPMLKYNIGRHNMFMPNLKGSIDLYAIFKGKKLLSANKLANAYQHYTAKSLHNAHSAEADTKACIEILKCMCKVGDVKAQSISLPEDLDLDESD